MTATAPLPSGDAPAPVPGWEDPADPRSAITLEHLLTMRDGLDFNEVYEVDTVSHVVEMLFGEGQADMAAYAAARTRSLWLDDLPPRDPHPPLRGDARADLCVVGGGYTGLWAALHALADAPGRDVVVLEATRCGDGASGRNGGFLNASITHGLANGLARFEPEMPALERLGLENFHGLIADLERHGIDAELSTTTAWIKDRTAGIDQLVAIFGALLALAVIVSLFGIVNTLVLSTFERTRELGMLRAVGMTRRQMRRMVRHESIITALLGALTGMAAGLGLAAIVTSVFADAGLSRRSTISHSVSARRNFSRCSGRAAAAKALCSI